MNTSASPGARGLGPVAVVLVTADWAGPARPAATILRELSRRWGEAVHTVLLQDADDAVLDLLGVEVIPTWLRFVGRSDQVPGEASGLWVPDLRGATVSGEAVVLPGPWALTHRRSGALPKHVVAAEFGPSDG